MSTLYHLLAAAVVGLHLAFVLFVALGGLLALWRRWLLWLHLPAAAWGIAIELAGGICPLTPLENALRRRAGLAGYEGDFVGRYLLPVLYPMGLTRETQWLLGLAVLAINGVIYYLVWRRSKSE